MMKYTYPFTEAEFTAAFETWGCNCGPGALAFACQVSLDRVRAAIPDFDVGAVCQVWGVHGGGKVMVREKTKGRAKR